MVPYSEEEELRIKKKEIKKEEERSIGIKGGSGGETPSSSLISVSSFLYPKVNELFEIWNANCEPLPKQHALDERLRLDIEARLKENPDPEYWKVVVLKMSKSLFLVGEPWANLRWLMKNPENPKKVDEGTYDPKKKLTNYERSRLIPDWKRLGYGSYEEMEKKYKSL